MARVVINSAAARALLQSDEVAADLERRARNIAAAAGDGMEVSIEIGPERARAAVITGTAEAKLAEATDRTLSSALDAGRD